MNSAKDEPKAAIHPLARDHITLRYDLQELAQLLNRVQHHTRCTSYCLRHPKEASKEVEKIYLYSINIIPILDMSFSLSTDIA